MQGVCIECSLCSDRAGTVHRVFFCCCMDRAGTVHRPCIDCPELNDQLAMFLDSILALKLAFDTFS